MMVDLWQESCSVHGRGVLQAWSALDQSRSSGCDTTGCDSLFGQVVLLDFCIKCLEADAENLCGHVLVPTDGLQHAVDMRFFDLDHGNSRPKTGAIAVCGRCVGIEDRS